jgi:hypothetical protein
MSLNMDLLTSDSVLLFIVAAFKFTDNFEMCIWGHILGGCIGSNMVDKMLSVLWLCLSGWCVSWRACHSAWVRSALTLLRSLWRHDLKVSKRSRGQQGKEVECVQEGDHEKMWEFPRNTLLASSQNGMRNSQLAHSTADEYCCEQLQVPRGCNQPAICTQSVRCWVFLHRDVCM